MTQAPIQERTMTIARRLVARTCQYVADIGDHRDHTAESEHPERIDIPTWGPDMIVEKSATVEIRPVDDVHDPDDLRLPLRQLYVVNIFQCYYSRDLLDKISTWPSVPINAHIPNAPEPRCNMCEACKEVESLKRNEQSIVAETAAWWSHQCRTQQACPFVRNPWWPLATIHENIEMYTAEAPPRYTSM
ncbi:hypothetical protein LTR97_007585 [Elasticomyces elasticus]|uniref:Uncharacterized protein n=1 Tax=Elasticomyces elasticus TaxID=574655 RepID=A0AAN8A100_9PEZI|nr:hypothetical protein LTR97_007585 [Elasticomyces elasticus]